MGDRPLAFAMIGVIVLAVCAAAYPLLARFVLHGPVTAESLAISGSRAAGSADRDVEQPRPCRGRGEARSCSVSDTQGSGAAGHRVGLRPGSSCWTATLSDDASESGMSRVLDGCVPRWQWSLL